MKRAVFSQLAELDLREIVDFIDRDNPTAAQSFITTIYEKCTTLASYPEMGRRRSGFKDSEIRTLAVGNYLIFYRPASQGVEISRILHGARDFESLL